jgi:uncharacterized protein
MMPKPWNYIACGTLAFLLFQDMATGFSQTPLTANAPTKRSSTESMPQLPSVATQTYRDTAHSIASKFSSTEFKPHPVLTNCHIQTISGVYLRSLEDLKYVSDGSNIGLLQTLVKSLRPSLFLSDAKRPLNPNREGFYDERQRFETQDGDFFDVDFKYHQGKQATSNQGMVIILHGLQSNSLSSLSVDMATAYLNRGFDVACINFRGCSGEMNRNLGGYHLGFTDDLRQFLGHLKNQREASITSEPTPGPLFLSGFSLGSNVVLKALGELGEQAHRHYNIYGAAVCGAPFDQERNVNFLQAPGFNRWVYMGTLLKSLRTRSMEQMNLLEGSEEWKKIDYKKIVDAETIADIENAVLAPIYGFEDFIDYYRKNSCHQFLDNITVPTLIINAADDPFFDPSFFPWDKSCDHNPHSPIKMLRTDHGGHLGFMFHQDSAEEDEGAKLNRAGVVNKERASWMPAELARFLDLARKERRGLDRVASNLASGLDNAKSVRHW